jgi:hypothetical protein
MRSKPLLTMFAAHSGRHGRGEQAENIMAIRAAR